MSLRTEHLRRHHVRQRVHVRPPSPGRRRAPARELEYRRIAQEREAEAGPTAADQHATACATFFTTSTTRAPRSGAPLAPVMTLVAGSLAAIPELRAAGPSVGGPWHDGHMRATVSPSLVGRQADLERARATPTTRASRARRARCWSAARRASARPVSSASSCGRFPPRPSCCGASPSTSTVTRRPTRRSSRRCDRSRRRSARRRCSTHPARRAMRSPCCCPS